MVSDRLRCRGGAELGPAPTNVGAALDPFVESLVHRHFSGWWLSVGGTPDVPRSPNKCGHSLRGIGFAPAKPRVRAALAYVLDIELLPVTEMRYCFGDSRTSGRESPDLPSRSSPSTKGGALARNQNVGPAIVLLVNDQQLTSPLLGLPG